MHENEFGNFWKSSIGVRIFDQNLLMLDSDFHALGVHMGILNITAVANIIEGHDRISISQV